MMLLRRVREHVVAHNWFAVSADLAIVVLGVFLGTQANNWNEARIERDQGHSYRTRLIGDLRSNEADMRQRQAYYSRVRQHALAALNAIERPSAVSDDDFLIDAYQATQIIPRSAKRFTYDEMMSVGGAQRLGDAKLRERIANYYVGLTTNSATASYVAPYRENLRQSMPYAVQRRIRSECPEKSGEDALGAPTASLTETCSLDLDPTIIAEAVEQVQSAQFIERDLTRLLIDLDLKLDIFRTQERRARELRAKLEVGNG